MGFPREAVKRALFYTYNQGLECAIKWLMDHITDNNFAEPFVPSRHNFNSGELIIITFYSDKKCYNNIILFNSVIYCLNICLYILFIFFF